MAVLQVHMKTEHNQDITSKPEKDTKIKDKDAKKKTKSAKKKNKCRKKKQKDFQKKSSEPRTFAWIQKEKEEKLKKQREREKRKKAKEKKIQKKTGLKGGMPSLNEEKNDDHDEKKSISLMFVYFIKNCMHVINHLFFIN